MARILQIRFSGGRAVTPDLPPSEGLTATGFQYDKILSKWATFQKKTVVSIFENMAMILKKPVFRGWYPLIYPLQEVWPSQASNMIKNYANE